MSEIFLCMMRYTCNILSQIKKIVPDNNEWVYLIPPCIVGRNIILYVAMYITTNATNIIIITEPDRFYFYGKLSVIQVFLIFCVYLMTRVKLQTSMTIKCRWVPQSVLWAHKLGNCILSNKNGSERLSSVKKNHLTKMFYNNDIILVIIPLVNMLFSVCFRAR